MVEGFTKHYRCKLEGFQTSCVLPANISIVETPVLPTLLVIAAMDFGVPFGSPTLVTVIAWLVSCAALHGNKLERP